ncbi:MAG: hypothetical protein QNI87_07965 [Erythrobacter sp.]|uniref:hypothetical protein n=1 Tax=Erythrobacter sp. TaxID=1042 RepID=UPI00262FC220|nr:hypothetical protein [Erythrobacter sp.]MDJ0978458.1 hypothetical protein [Erythrobacter sp.]
MRRVQIVLLSSVWFAVLITPSLANDPGSKREQEMRALQEAISKLENRYDKLLRRCSGPDRPDRRACDNARVTYADIQELRKQLSALSKAPTPEEPPPAAGGR